MNLKHRIWLAVGLLMALLSIAAVTQLDLTTQVRGILAITNGGTGLASAGASGLAPVSNGSAYVATDVATQTEIDAHTQALIAHQFAGDFTIAGRPAATGISGKWVVVTDALTAGDCTTGGGSALALCRSNGSTWVALGDGKNTGTAINFADGETPTGTINGSNAVFTVVNSPSPAASLRVFKNGQRMTVGASADYTLTGNTITFTSGAIPKTGDVLLADYRY